MLFKTIHAPSNTSQLSGIICDRKTILPVPPMTMQTKKETSKPVAGSLYRDIKAYPEATLASMVNRTRGNQRKISYRKKHSGKREHIIQMMYGERVHPLAKLLTITSIPPLRKSENRFQDFDKQKLLVEAALEQISVSEKEYNVLNEGSSLEVALSPLYEVCGTYEAIEGQEMIQKKLPKSATINLNKSFTTHSATSHHAKIRRKPFNSVKTCVCEDHPLSTFLQESSNAEQNSSQDRVENINQQAVPKIYNYSSNALRLNLSFQKIKFVVNSILFLINPPPLPDNSTTRSSRSIESELSRRSKGLPLQLERVPTTELRWYLNPTPNASIEALASTPCNTKCQRGCEVSIQMQTYKISISKVYNSHHIISIRTKPTSEELTTEAIYEPKVRRRDMRENSDFLRVAVMEMLMRKRGKLDDEAPGQARLILPPRTLLIRPPETTTGGIPARWIPLTA